MERTKGGNVENDEKWAGRGKVEKMGSGRQSESESELYLFGEREIFLENIYLIESKSHLGQHTR